MPVWTSNPPHRCWRPSGSRLARADPWAIEAAVVAELRRLTRAVERADDEDAGQRGGYVQTIAPVIAGGRDDQHAALGRTAEPPPPVAGRRGRGSTSAPELMLMICAPCSRARSMAGRDRSARWAARRRRRAGCRERSARSGRDSGSDAHHRTAPCREQQARDLGSVIAAALRLAPARHRNASFRVQRLQRHTLETRMRHIDGPVDHRERHPPITLRDLPERREAGYRRMVCVRFCACMDIVSARRRFCGAPPRM